jgi:hypothetical protein
MSAQFSTPTPTTTDPNVLVCVNHPNRETHLRCNRCGDPICPECAVLTPTGYRCKKCVRGQQKTFETARPLDYVFAVVISVVLGYVGSFIAQYLGFFTLFIAPIAGVIIAEAVRAAVRRRRSRALFLTATVSAVIGSAPQLLFALLSIFLGGSALGGLFGLIWPAVYTFLVASTVYYRLSGIQMTR